MKQFFLLMLMSWQLAGLPCWSQQIFGRKLTHWSVAITNSHSAKPFGSFSKLVYSQWHPGIEAATGFNWKSRKHHDWFQTLRAGYFYHRWVQHSILLFTEYGYRYNFPGRVSSEIKLGAGYMHAIPDSKIFELTSDGYKKKGTLGRPQAMADFSLGISKTVSPRKAKVFIEYQQRFSISFYPFLCSIASI
ncbi:MAG: hypothetical protein HC867_00735 [Bacteroidia bacterium]|nr:hypothetical protein [Bacteroidia bacterium]